MGRVLIMDDEPAIRRGLARLLGLLGYESEASENGELALECYRTGLRDGAPFDLVVLDMAVAKGMGGEETLRRLREIDPKVRAVVSSGYTDYAARLRFEALGFAAILSKPYDLKTLKATLQAASTK